MGVLRGWFKAMPIALRRVMSWLRNDSDPVQSK